MNKNWESLIGLTVQGTAGSAVTFRVQDYTGKFYGPFTLTVGTSSSSIATLGIAQNIKIGGSFINWGDIVALIPSSVTGTISYNLSDGAEAPNTYADGTLVARQSVKGAGSRMAYAGSAEFASRIPSGATGSSATVGTTLTALVSASDYPKMIRTRVCNVSSILGGAAVGVWLGIQKDGTDWPGESEPALEDSQHIWETYLPDKSTAEFRIPVGYTLVAIAQYNPDADASLNVFIDEA